MPISLIHEVFLNENVLKCQKISLSNEIPKCKMHPTRQRDTNTSNHSCKCARVCLHNCVHLRMCESDVTYVCMCDARCEASIIFDFLMRDFFPYFAYLIDIEQQSELYQIAT